MITSSRATSTPTWSSAVTPCCCPHGSPSSCDTSPFPGAGTALAPLLGLFTKVVTEAEVAGLGTLSLGFDDGTRLCIEPDPDYESWSLTGSGL
ncbi:DUF6188 family protein, partial [Streptomyces albidoflavus]